MIDVGNPEAIVLNCEHCGKPVSIEDIHGKNYGNILLNGKNDGYIGNVCPECMKTTLKKCDRDFIEFIKKPWNIGVAWDIGAMYECTSILGFYDSFPFIIDYHPGKKPKFIDHQIDYSDTDSCLKYTADFVPTGSIKDKFREPDEGYCSYIFDHEAINYPAIAIWWYHEKDLNDLVNIENETGLKVFPRYIRGDSWYIRKAKFCYDQHLITEVQEYMNPDGESLHDVWFSGSPEDKITRSFEFLKAIQFIPLYYYQIGEDIFVSGNTNKYKEEMYIHKEIVEKIWKYFTKEHIQEILYLTASSFIFEYLDLAKRIDFSDDDVFKLQIKYLEKIHESTKSYRKRKQVKEDTFKVIQQKVQEFEKKFGGVKIISQDLEINEIKIKIAQLAPSKISKIDFLLQGETGTGKELFARAIHEASGRKGQFVPVNCASIPKDLFESEFFGHEKGAFTDAKQKHIGYFEQADGGTIFLDEIGELDLNIQKRFLRVLENREIQPIGGSSKRVDVKIIYATNKNLKEMVRNRTFREDLYHRINMFEFLIPPLRERKDDVLILVRYFIKKFDNASENETDIVPIRVTDECMEVLKKYPWPGNVRELENVIIKIMVLRSIEKDRGDITPSDLPEKIFSGNSTIKGQLNQTKGRKKRPPDEELVRLKKDGLTQDQVAEQFDARRETVNRWYADIREKSQSTPTSPI